MYVRPFYFDSISLVHTSAHRPSDELSKASTLQPSRPVNKCVYQCILLSRQKQSACIISLLDDRIKCLDPKTVICVQGTPLHRLLSLLSCATRTAIRLTKWNTSKTALWKPFMLAGCHDSTSNNRFHFNIPKGNSNCRVRRGRRGALFTKS